MNTGSMLKKDMEKVLRDLDEETVVLSAMLAAVPDSFDPNRAWNDVEKNRRARRINRMLEYISSRMGLD